jgi:cell fate regulator YaaT (PSP1 superfamily)
MQEVCKKCGKIHKNRIDLEVSANREELESIKLIIEKSTCVNQVLNSFLSVIPVDANKLMVSEIISSAIDKRAEVNYLERDWWESAIKKYNLIGETYIDFDNGRFFRYD